MGTANYILNVQIFYHRLEVVKQVCNFSKVVYFLSYVWYNVGIFSREVEKLLFLGMM